LHRIAWNRITSHHIALHRIASHLITWHGIASHRIVSHGISSHAILAAGELHKQKPLKAFGRCTIGSTLVGSIEASLSLAAW
jgi:hypothetical protein